MRYTTVQFESTLTRVQEIIRRKVRCVEERSRTLQVLSLHSGSEESLRCENSVSDAYGEGCTVYIMATGPGDHR